MVQKLNEAYEFAANSDEQGELQQADENYVSGDADAGASDDENEADISLTTKQRGHTVMPSTSSSKPESHTGILASLSAAVKKTKQYGNNRELVSTKI